METAWKKAKGLVKEHITGLSRKSPDIINIMRTVCMTSMSRGSQGEQPGMHMSEQWWLHCTS